MMRGVRIRLFVTFLRCIMGRYWSTMLYHRLAAPVEREHRSMRRSYEVNEQHLIDESAPSEWAFCGADSSTEERVSVGYYMEQRKNGFGVGSVCESCKAFAPPFALRRSRDLEAEGKLDKAQEYRRLYETLLRETGQDRSGD